VYRKFCGNIYACGERSAGERESARETPLREAGTEHDLGLSSMGKFRRTAMVNEAQQYLATDPWMMIGPALAIVIVLVSLNILGDAVRDHLDPRDMIGASKPL